MSRNLGFSAAVLLLVAGLCEPAANAQQLIPANARKAAPELSIPDLDGRDLSLRQLRGKVVLLDFWAVDCGGCKLEIPWYVDFDRKYRNRGLQLIGIDMYGETPSMIREFMSKSGMQYPVAIGSDEVGARFGLEAMPLTLLIDREGRIAVSHAGVVDPDAFERDIQELLR